MTPGTAKIASSEASRSAATEPAVAAPAGAIAVLPFSNLSSEPDTEYFSDGLTEELIHGLTKVGGLMVVAWNSAARLKGQPYDVREIGRQLSVSTVLVGTVFITINLVSDLLYKLFDPRLRAQ